MQERSLCMVLLWLFFNNRWRISLTLRIAVSDNSEDPIWLGYSSKILNTSWGCTRTSLLLCDLKTSGCRGSFWSWANLNQRGRGISLGNFCILPLPTGSYKTSLLKAILFFFFWNRCFRHRRYIKSLCKLFWWLVTPRSRLTGNKGSSCCCTASVISNTVFEKSVPCYGYLYVVAR